MKTIITRVLAVLIILTTVAAATNPVQAQRRSRSNRGNETRVERDKRSRTNNSREKSTYRPSDRKKRSENAALHSGSSREPGRSRSLKSASRAPEERSRRATINNKPSYNEKRSTYRNNSSKPSNPTGSVRMRSKSGARAGLPASGSRERRNYSPANNREKSRDGLSGNRSSRDRSRSYSASDAEKKTTANTRSSRSGYNRKVYRLDRSEKRTVPAKNYRGSEKYWSSRQATRRPNHRNNDGRYYKKYDYRKYKHWDRKWERFRWNRSSWRDYYSSYHPYSYRFHKYYYHHPRYGHVIRRFTGRPWFFIHNHHRYYCFDGHFFRYYRGVGYVLVDMPYGIIFERIPVGYEQVYINGYLYFRTGNLFFEMTRYGFRLVHYPERYFAYDENFVHGGYTIPEVHYRY